MSYKSWRRANDQAVEAKPEKSTRDHNNTLNVTGNGFRVESAIHSFLAGSPLNFHVSMATSVCRAGVYKLPSHE